MQETLSKRPWRRRLAVLFALLLLLLLLGLSLAWLDRPLDAQAIAVAAGLPEIPAQLPPARPPAGLDFRVIETSQSRGTLEALILGGGSWLRLRQPVHMAVWVRHPRASFLFDLGLGAGVDQQFAVNHLFHRLVFGYGPVRPAAAQLAAIGAPRPDFALVSHLHWDHVSGLPDFPGLPLWVPAAERAEAEAGAAPYFLRSQFQGHQAWRELRFEGGPYLGFPAHQDLFGDGSAVLVPLDGHTAGQIGLFLTLPSGARYLFSGDVSWTLEGIARPADRSWLARHLLHLDHDEARNQATLVQLHRLMRAHPGLQIVPAHDETLLPRLPRLTAPTRP
ncbi:MBL fold metallo-hydrolase [Kinneretia asaccharophila]|uniref:Glyoxylase-like metal-dependent hydrolase (Beta-lactamase superfamily II) n=1 Tax=Roseateles asaccharophilus TaxID=582607 RepID=A0A4R6NBA6_9BURK|nr:MBL fold metallo-hydrolase [Roseateles asaccharophilus]MDN3543266.1 MBL fold metallo-hydrolase [Roseateles asaccharophilus]TDP13036.1 glyoxylase-like metal-dependent hydrolase (beta-lactamase superfamily II) [Roseateles asaccharophilus]